MLSYRSALIQCFLSLTFLYSCSSNVQTKDWKEILPDNHIISDKEFSDITFQLKDKRFGNDTILLGFKLGESRSEIDSHLAELKAHNLINAYDSNHFKFQIVSQNRLFNCLGIIHYDSKLNGIYCLIGAPEHLLPKLPLEDCEGEGFNPWTSAQCKANKITNYESEYKITVYRYIDSAFDNLINAYKIKYGTDFYQTENKGDWNPYIWFNRGWLLKLQIQYENASSMLEYYGGYQNVNTRENNTSTLDPSFFFPKIATIFYFSNSYYYELMTPTEEKHRLQTDTSSI